MITQNDPRRWRERADGTRVYEDPNAASNLPTEVNAREIPYHDVPINPSASGDLPNYGKPMPGTLDIQFFNASKGKK